MARRHGATEEELASLADADAGELPEADAAAIRFAEKVTVAHRDLSEADIRALLEYWRPEQIVELMCVIGEFNYLNRFSIAFGLWPTRPGEGGPEDREGAPGE